MKVKKENTNILPFVWSLIRKKRKNQLLLILPIILIGSLSEALSIAAIVPFLINIINKNKINIENNSINFLENLIPNTSNFLFVLLVLIVLFSVIFRLISIYSYNKWTALVGSDLSFKTFSYFTNISYSNFKQTKEVEITNILHTSINNTTAYIYSFITIIICLITSLGFIVTGLFLNARLFILIFILLSLIYSLIFYYSKSKLNSIGIVQHRFIQNAYKYINYTYGNFKDIKLENNNLFINNIYLENDLVRRITGSQKKIISLYPKIIIEAIAIIIVSSIIIFLDNSGKYSVELGIDILIISLIFSRLLPVFQLIYSSWTALKVSSYSIFQLKDFLEKKNQARNFIVNKKLKNKLFETFDFLEVRNLTQRYQNKDIFKDINFKINQGEWIGIYGKSGAGKSTLLDAMMGLLKTTKGQIIINGTDIYKSSLYFYWRNSIAHCSAEPFLIDSDVISNIKSIFNSKKLDLKRLKLVWHCAALDEFISMKDALKIYNHDDFKNNLNYMKTYSSGQKQRIAIARTLYKNKEVIMLDEFTSALDSQTEKIILERLKKNYSDKTFILISHRKYPLEFCEKLIKLGE